MAKQNDRGISWCDYTFNPWWGCEKCSPACDSCYAEAWQKRCGFDCFGPWRPARIFGAKHWGEPFKWDNAAKAMKTKYRVFCGSMCDIFQYRIDIEIQTARLMLWETIEKTPNLIWLLLTKRPEHAEDFIPSSWRKSGWPGNVWFGVTAENQEMADLRISRMLRTKAAHFFVSCEPLLGQIDLNQREFLIDKRRFKLTIGRYLDWVIAGGESGSKARPSNPDDFRFLRDQCIEVGIPFHFKQWGEWAPGLGFITKAKEVKHFNPNFQLWQDGAGQHYSTRLMYRVGKKIAGHLLYGKEWLQFPEMG